MVSRFFKVLAGALFALAVVFVVAVPAQAAPISLFVDGQEIATDVAPYAKNGRTYVPMRFAAEPLGGVASWEGGNVKAATILRGRSTVKIPLGSAVATVNGRKKELDAPAESKNGRIFVPIRFVAESLNATVEWDGAAKAVRIWSREGDNLYDTFQYVGYYYTAKSFANLERYQSELTGVDHFAYALNADGSLELKSSAKTDRYAAEGDLIAESAYLNDCVLVTGFSKAGLVSVFTDPTARANAIINLCSLVNEGGYVGVDLDFESVPVDQRENFVAFVKDLRAELGNDKLLNLSLMPRAYAYETWLDGYDYAGLAQVADYLLLMCYNEHYSGGEPGPVASRAWVEDVLNYTLDAGVPAERIILALGAYGYDWATGGNGKSCSFTTAFARAATYGAPIYRDGETGCPYYLYTDTAGIDHEVWFEDAESLGQKAALAQEYALGGLAVWRLDFLDDAMWGKLRAACGDPAAEWQAAIDAAPQFEQKDRAAYGKE